MSLAQTETKVSTKNKSSEISSTGILRQDDMPPSADTSQDQQEDQTVVVKHANTIIHGSNSDDW